MTTIKHPPLKFECVGIQFQILSEMAQAKNPREESRTKNGYYIVGGCAQTAIFSE